MTINSRKIHQLAGLTLVIPMILWVLTGLFFFIKPGYQQAYEQLSISTYPLNVHLSVAPQKNWQEIKLVRSILGHHLLVKVDGKTQHLNPTTLQPLPLPNNQQIKKLITDTVKHNKTRYGEIKHINGNQITTSTNINIELNWQTLGLQQTGSDKKFINTLYKIHYLQWTPNKTINQILGISGLLLLMTLTIYGVKLYLTRQK